MRRLAVLAALAAAVGLGACKPELKAPEIRGVCYSLGILQDGSYKFSKVADRVPDLEHCAVELERVRISFLRMGGNQTETIGAYQGNYLFLKKEGIYVGSTLKGPRYIALTRYQDRLIVPGAIQQQ